MREQVRAGAGLGRGLLAGLGSPSLTHRTGGALRPWLILHGSSIRQCRLPLGRTPSFQASLGGAAEDKAPEGAGARTGVPGRLQQLGVVALAQPSGLCSAGSLTGCYVLSRSQPPRSCPPFPPPETPSLYLTCPSGATEPPPPETTSGCQRSPTWGPPSSFQPSSFPFSQSFVSASFTDAFLPFFLPFFS